jgi:hypothetical protein
MRKGDILITDYSRQITGPWTAEGVYGPIVSAVITKIGRLCTMQISPLSASGNFTDHAAVCSFGAAIDSAYRPQANYTFMLDHAVRDITTTGNPEVTKFMLSSAGVLTFSPPGGNYPLYIKLTIPYVITFSWFTS